MTTDPHWITTPITAELLRGAIELERTAHGLLPHRLPARARTQCTDGQLAMVEAQPSGVRLAFRTRATAVELDTLPTKRLYVGAPPRPDGVYDLHRRRRDARRQGDGLTWRVVRAPPEASFSTVIRVPVSGTRTPSCGSSAFQ